MLNRRILRIKAFKVLYSYSENPGMTLADAESMLESSCEATRDLYLYMLSLIPVITEEAVARMEAAKNRFNATKEDLEPNLKFAQNAIAPLILDDPDFQKIVSKKKLSWEPYDAFVRNLFKTVSEKEYFKKYMASEERSISQDAALFVKIFEEELVDNVELEKILEDLSLLWIDDLAYSLSWCITSLKALGKGERWNLPPLYQSDVLISQGKPADSDKAFVVKLLRSAFSSFPEYYQLISEQVPSWDKARLFNIDMALISLGLAEATTFKEIPVKVTINEYVEISKYYSTPKSCSFINGLLDKLIQKFQEEGKVSKSGKGLM